MEKQVQRTTSAQVIPTEEKNVRFTAKGLRSHRAKLGLSAADYGKLVGVSALTIYNWEKEVSRPRQQQVVSLAAVRQLGKKEVLGRLG